ncbi:hypothetical protein BSKO_10495 [Bryopsis sp. KO-2023]|nr:hypothetical protein BSKO_10495 [Bryopsis sp. KO-2023]
MFRALLITGVTMLAVRGIDRLVCFLGNKLTRDATVPVPRRRIAWPPRDCVADGQPQGSNQEMRCLATTGE